MTASPPPEPVRPVEGQIDRRRLALGSLALGVSNALKVGLQVLMVPLMARLLGPGEFGLYALALPTVGFLLMLAEGGLANSMAREPNANRVAWASAFWALQVAAVVMALLAIALSFPIANVAGQPRLPGLMAFLSVSFFALVWAVLPTARLMRDARLEYGAYSDFAATVLGAAVAIWLATHGAGAWSLAAQFVATLAIKAFVLNILAPVGPRLMFSWMSLRGHLEFGGAVLGSKVSGFVGSLAENALVGRWLGAPALGAYSLSNQIPRFLCDAVGNPLWANLYVQALRHTAEETAETYYRITRLFGLLVIPASTLLAAAMGPIVELFLGPRWAGTGLLLTILLPATGIGAIGGLCGALLMARSQGRLLLILSGGFAVGRLLSIALTPFYGLTGAAAGVAAMSIIATPINILVVARSWPIKPGLVARLLAAPILASMVAGVLCWAVISTRAPSLPFIIACEVGAFAVFCLLMFILDRRAVRKDWDNLGALLSKRPAESIVPSSAA